jgi:hypothetical protein
MQVMIGRKALIAQPKGKASLSYMGHLLPIIIDFFLTYAILADLHENM